MLLFERLGLDADDVVGQRDRRGAEVGAVVHEPPGPLAAHVGELIDIVVHRRRAAIDQELIVLELPQQRLEQDERQLDLVGDFAARAVAARQQVLEDQRLRLRCRSGPRRGWSAARWECIRRLGFEDLPLGRIALRRADRCRSAGAASARAAAACDAMPDGASPRRTSLPVSCTMRLSTSFSLASGRIRPASWAGALAAKAASASPLAVLLLNRSKSPKSLPLLMLSHAFTEHED